MHYAVHGQTAAELIVNRANAEKEHMGLTTWENAPDGKIVKTDVSIAKNYLKGIELEDMGRLVNAVLYMAERVTARIAAFMPGASPPEVKIPTHLMLSIAQTKCFVVL